MFDYEKWLKDLESSGAEDLRIEIAHAEKSAICNPFVSISGNKKGLLYLASSIIEYVLDDANTEKAKFNLNFDSGVDLTSASPSLSINLFEDEYWKNKE